MSAPTYQPGDHLRVRRGLYWHHGIYVGDDMAVDFSGGSIADKAKARVHEVTLADFARGAAVEVVAHPERFLFGLGMGLPEPLPRDEIVDRARWVAANCPPARYHLVGSNCEHVASWCVTGGYFESLQVRRIFAVSTFVANPVLFARLLRFPAVRRNMIPIALVALAFTTGPVLYNLIPYRFWRFLPTYAGYPGVSDAWEKDEE